MQLEYVDFCAKVLPEIMFSGSCDLKIEFLQIVLKIGQYDGHYVS